MHHNPITPAAAGADSPSTLSPLAAHLKQTCLGWPAYGLPFSIALDSALSHLDRGATITPISPTAYRVQALPHAAGYRVTMGRCACDAAAAHLVVAQGSGS